MFQTHYNSLKNIAIAASGLLITTDVASILYSEVTSHASSLYHKTTICWKDASNVIIGKS